MKHFLGHIIALSIFTFLSTTPLQAETLEKMVIALKTTDFELTETDISDLAIGEARTIETDSGKVIDVLRTADGAEIYVDGELLEMNIADEGTHGQHTVSEHVEVICHDEEDCDTNVVIVGGNDHENSDHVILHKEIEVSCSDEEEGTRCADKMVWRSDGEEKDIEELHEMHEDSGDHKVIVIRKHAEKQD
ncbi:MAG: hypothetical protein HKP21_09300 [Xanthomonadales bacterium]|nr:hypothetical protein [Gammaproteobacteria bacterium]MBT8073891.1 hypothetical protein [Gammaproteobacteria bacterium]MBT8076127.1 hypothetical protein [Gammaproteobacteria bacterium]NNK04738.1 hypothetical protein [Xanthomonadales bacterium]NNK97785.1 hypothetical protein [Xanthomonadales bacterium]